ncbi:MAG TPA: carboxymuconolactone decarboxylase family protein [Phycisphaerae bacterium]|jgi:AhpD family alkylhydroperoxidase|nr:carboxymuconolactone decarboxylase family protein [Phycisphaerae bacterium]
MKPRIEPSHVPPGGFRAMLGLEEYLHGCGLPPNLMHLLKLRASQINGCAYCIDMHWKDLRAIGEPEHRLYALDAWRESPWYSDKERAALEWAEEVTLISTTHAGDAAYEKLKAQFSEKEIADLTLLLATINAWNRLAISMRSLPGVYVSKLKPPAPAMI